MKQKINILVDRIERYVRTDVRYVTQSTFWIVLGKICISLLSAVTMIAFANLASKELFGNYQYIITVLGLVSVLSLPGLNTALTRSVAMGYEASTYHAYRTKMKWGLVAGVVLVGVSIWYFSHGNGTLGWAFILGAVLAPLKDTYETYLYVLNGKKQFGTRMLYDVLLGIGTAVAVIVALLLNANLLVVIGAFLGSRVLTHIGASFFIKKSIQGLSHDTEMITYGKQLTTTNGLTQIIFSVDKLLVFHLLGPVSVALYVFAMNPIKMLQGFIPVGQVALPKLSNKKYISKKELFRKALLLFWIALPLAIVLFFAAPLIYKIFFNQYASTVPYFRALLLIIVFIPFSLLQTYLIATQRAKELLRIRTVTLTLRFVGFLVFIPLFKLWGAIWVAVGINTLSSVMVIYYFIKAENHVGQ